MAGGRVAPWLVVACACVWGLPACSGGGEVAEESPVAATEPAPAPTPTPEPAPVPEAAPAPEPAPEAPAPPLPGGDSPQDVVTRLAAASEQGDVAAIINLIEPEERRGMVAMMGLMPPLMNVIRPFVQMQAQGAAQMAEGEDGAAKAEKMMAEFDALVSELGAVCKEHRAELPPLGELGIDPMAMAGRPNPRELAKKIGSRLDHVDGGAFVAAMMGHMESLGKLMGQGGGGQFDQLKAKFGSGELADCVIEGDAATGTLGGEPVHFTRVDGRWYVRVTPPPVAEEQPEMDPEPDEGMGGGKEDDEDKGGEDDGGGR